MDGWMDGWLDERTNNDFGYKHTRKHVLVGTPTTTTTTTSKAEGVEGICNKKKRTLNEINTG